ncbi:MAG: DUF6531 domain-containing protein, partial [Acidobacteriota bacterium]
ALNGNVLLISAASGGILAYDIADPASLRSSSLPLGYVAPGSNEYWGIASDQHGRVFATGTNGVFGFVQSYRLEDFVGDGSVTSPPRVISAPRSAATVAWVPGSTAGAGLATDTILSDRPEGIPRKLQLAVQDNDLSFASLAEFTAGLAPLGISATSASVGGGFTKLKVMLPLERTFAYRTQRITIENTTRDMRWSADAVDATPAVIDNVVAQATDQLRIVWNERTYGIVTIFGYGVGIFDLNAVEANDTPNAPTGYKPLAERIRLTRAALDDHCPPFEPAPEPVQDLALSPDTSVIAGEAPGTLNVYGVDVHKGVLDVRLDAAEAPSAIGTPVCIDRAPQGLLLSPARNPRIADLNRLFALKTGRSPFGHFNGAQTYHWVLEAEDNKAVGPPPSPGLSAPGQRNSNARERVVRDYLLVPGNEYGLLVVDASMPKGWLTPANLADVIWIPAGAVAVRVIPRTNLATVVDGDGRVLLVDLAHIDERSTSAGAPFDANALFPTAAAALSATGAYDVGAPDPRILWTSEKGLVNGSLAPVIDADTGILFAGRLFTKTTSVVAVTDPHLRMKADLGTGGLAEIGGVVPLGIDPPNGVLTATPDASLAAFRLELTLPGGAADALAGGQLRLSVESERVPGGAVEQTPAPSPRAHLRMNRPGGLADPRASSTFIMTRDIPAGMENVLRHQKGFNKFVSPWVVAVADPRASIAYDPFWPTSADKTAAGCFHCDRPARLKGQTEANGVFELWSAGRDFVVHPELCGGTITGCTGANIFTGTKYAYLSEGDRLTARFPTVMADTVRTPEVLTAAQAPAVFGGMLQETIYAHSGELATSHVDLSAGGRAGWTVDFDRSYRSRTMVPDFLGRGWSSSMFRRLRALPNGSVEYRDGSGEVWLFRPPLTPYIAPPGLPVNLIRTNDGWQLVDQRRRVTTFDSMGRLSTESDEFGGSGYTGQGNTIRYIYDRSGRLVRIFDPVSRVSRLDYYDESQPGWKAGRLKSVVDWRGRRVDYDYDAAGLLRTAALPEVENTDRKRPTITYDYEPVGAAFNDSLELGGLLKSIKDPSAATPRVSFTFGSGTTRGRVRQQTWATGESATFAYDSGSATSTDALGQLRNYTLTAAPTSYFADRVHVASLTEVGVPTAKIAFGQLPLAVSPTAVTTEPKDRRFTFGYEDGLLKTSSLAEVVSQVVDYKPHLTEPSRLPSTVTTTPEGAPAPDMPPSAGITITREVTYEPGSPYVSEVKANGIAIKTAEPHRDLPDLMTTVANDSIISTSTFDSAGRLKEAQSSGGLDAASAGSDVKITYRGDSTSDFERGLPELIDNSGSLTTFKYPDVNTVVEIDPRGITTTTKRDEWDRPVDVVVSGDPELHETWSYDANGWLRTHTRKQTSAGIAGSTVTTTYDYDAMGRAISTSTDNIVIDGTATSRTTTVTYDLTRHTITTELKPGLSKTTQTVDSLGRTLASETPTGTTSIVGRYAYDLAGNLVFQTDNFVASASAYDAHGRQIATLAQDGTKTIVDHDAWGRAKDVKALDAAGTTTAHTTVDLSAAGRVKQVASDIDVGTTRTSDFLWDGAGRITRSATSHLGAVMPTGPSAGDHRASQTVFDLAGRLKQAESGAGVATGAIDTFDKTVVDAFVNVASHLPESVRRFEKGISVAYNSSYGYDTNANVTRTDAAALHWKQRFDEAGNVTSASLPQRPQATYEHDARGATTEETTPDDARNKYKWSATDALKQFTDPTSEATTTDTDLIGRPLARVYHDGTRETYEWEGT